MSKENMEVNDIEKVEIEPVESEEEEEVDKELDDVEEKDTPSVSSSDDKPDDTTEDEEDKDDKTDEEEIVKKEESLESEEDKDIVEPSEIKRLSDETPREYALRLEVTRLKRNNREKRTKELLGKIKSEKPSELSQDQYNDLNEDDKQILSEYDTNELNTFEKILNVLAKKHGWIGKGELQATTKNQASEEMLDKFLETHSEYLPENDKDNLLWGRFKEEFKLYKIPENPKDLKRIFNKIHKDIFGVKPDDELKKINAQKEKVKVASHSGLSASRGQSSSEETHLTPEQKSHLKGFSDKDFTEMGL